MIIAVSSQGSEHIYITVVSSCTQNTQQMCVSQDGYNYNTEIHKHHQSGKTLELLIEGYHRIEPSAYSCPL